VRPKAGKASLICRTESVLCQYIRKKASQISAGMRK